MSSVFLDTNINPRRSEMLSENSDHGVLSVALKCLGFGYNVKTGVYCSVESLTRPLVEKQLTKNDVIVTPVLESDCTVVEGSTFDEYTEKLSEAAGIDGSYGGFRGSLEQSFGSTNEGSRTTAFCSISRVSTQAIATLKNEVSLDREFKDDLREVRAGSMMPFRFFDKWGTHYVNKVGIGGRYDAGFTTETTTSFHSSDFSAAVRASYESPLGISSVSGHASVDIQNKTSSTRYECSTHVSCCGGAGNNVDYNTWVESVDRYPAPMSFPSQGLGPIYDLCKGEYSDIRKTLQEAMKDYFRPPLSIRLFSAKGPTAQHPSVDLIVPDGYKILGGGAVLNRVLQGGNPTKNYLTDSYPVSATQWHAEAKDQTSVSSDSLIAYAFAVYDPDNALKVQIFEKTGGPPSPHPVATVKVQDGYLMTGGGAKVEYSGYGNMLVESHPLGDTKDTWIARSSDHIQGCSGTIIAYAIGIACNNQKAYPRFKVGDLDTEILSMTNNQSNEEPTATVGIASGTQLVGGGASVKGDGAYGLLLTGSYPDSESSWKATAHDNEAIDTGTVTVSAIGLKGLPTLQSS